MGLLAAGLGFGHRCTVQRDANAGTVDSWDNPVAPDYQDHLTDQPCLARQLTLRDKRMGPEAEFTVEQLETLEDLRLYLPFTTDVALGDRIANVTANGATLLAGPLGIVSVLKQAGPLGPSHIELILTREA